MDTPIAKARSLTAGYSSTLSLEIKLTPIRKRQTRPSFSPVKTPKTVAVPARRASSGSAEVNTLPPDPDVPNAALEFEEFSFIGPNGDMQEQYAGKYLNAFYIYLADNFDCSYVEFLPPFLVLGFEGEIPAEDQRPFSIAGIITFWVPAGGPGYPGPGFIPLIGDWAAQEEIDISDAILDQIEWCKMPSDEVILYLANHLFRDCEAISVLWGSFIVELPKTSPEDHLERLRNLPRGIRGSRFSLYFHNGPLPNTPRRPRAIEPNPVHLENLVADETDYVFADGKFYPGSMISSTIESGEINSSNSAGVLVERGEDRRLTCSWHNWEDLDKKNSGRFGQTDVETQRIFQVNQGIVDGKPGTKVGFVRERMGDTDIALAQLDNNVKFENQFMDVKASAKAFVPSEKQEIGDKYIMDSVVTGRQMLEGLGKRRVLTRSRRSAAHPDLFAPKGRHDSMPPDTVAYIRYKQGIFATNSPIIATKPQIRDRACGAVLLRYHDITKDGRNTPVAEGLKRGEVCAMMHFADLQPKHFDFTAASYIMYADVFDPLIEEGWTVVHSEGSEEEMPPKGDYEGLKVEVEAKADFEESPTKKQRLV